MRASDLKPGDHFKVPADPRVFRLLSHNPEEMWQTELEESVFAVAENSLVRIHPDCAVEMVPGCV